MTTMVKIFAISFAAVSVTITSSETSTNSPVKDIGEGRLQIGLVTVSAPARKLKFPAKVNMTQGMVEYLIVTAKGKTHESLLSTEAEPVHIHAGMLLLGAKIEATSDPSVFFDTERAISGARLSISVSLPVPPPNTTKSTPQDTGKNTEIQTLLMFAETKQPLPPGSIPHWVYNGSRFSETPDLESVAAGSPSRSGGTNKEPTKIFMAQREGSIVSLIADPSALINNPRKDRENDELWILNANAIPPVGTPVEVTFNLE